MNIGIVTTWFERGAAYVSKQYRKVLSQNNNVYIFARGGEEYAKCNNVWDDEKVYWSQRIPNQITTYFKMEEFENWIENNSIECVLFNEQLWWEPILYCNKRKIKCGAYIDYYTEETIPFFEHYDFLICNTKRHYQVFKTHPQAFFIKWGTETELFVPMDKRYEDREKIVFFHSAGFNPKRKGTDKIFDAYLRLRHKYNNCKLIIHTQVELKDIMGIYGKDFEDNDIEVIKKNVTAPGLYHYGDVYLYPSILDGIGLTVAEALSSGLPVILTDNPPMNEFGNEEVCKKIKVKEFHSRRDGYYWPEVEIDVKDLYDKMKAFMDNYDSLEDYKRKAREYACKYLNWGENAKKLNEIFSTVKILDHSGNDFETVKFYDNKMTPFETRFDEIWSKIIRIYEKIENTEAPIFLCPAGNQTRKILKFIPDLGKKIQGLIDNKMFTNEKYPIYKKDILKKYPTATIYISSYYYANELINDIKKIPEFEGTIITIFDSKEDLL